MNTTKQFLWLVLLSFGLLSLPTFAATALTSANVWSICSKPDTTTVDCSGKSIISVATNTFASATYANTAILKLDNNLLTTINSWAFNKLSKLVTLNLNNNQITTINSFAFSWLSKVTSLDLNTNRLTTINSWTFNGLTGLVNLFLNSNSLTTINSWAFNGLSALTMLDLNGNQLTTINSWAFSVLSNLTNLNFSYNQLTTIESWSFSVFPSLLYLYLSANQLTTIENWIFNWLANLTMLELGSNQLVTISSWAFDGLQTLNTLMLSNNLLTNIESWIFNGLSNLGSLYLDINQLTTIEDWLFNELSALTELNISSNQLTTISSWVFNGLSALTMLDLNNNQITTIESWVFGDLSNLTNLNLSINQLTTINNWIFNGLSALIMLDLNTNLLTTIESWVFANLPALNILDLNYNPITTIEYWVFSGLSLLNELYLGINQLTTINSWIFNWLESLTYLYLGNSQITTINSWAFNGLFGLNNLDLKSNRLTTIENWIFNSLPFLNSLDLNNNQLISIESWAFDGMWFDSLSLYNNCLDTDDTALTEYLDSFAAIYAEQYVCLWVNYTPKTQTSGPVVWNLFLFGGPETKRLALSWENPDIGLLSHTWTENGIYSFDLSSIIDSNSYLRQLVNAQTILTGKVTWITPVDHVAEAFSGVDTALFTSGIVGNLDQVDASNYTAFSGLTFEKRINPADASTAVGSITFDWELDLSDAATQAFLQNLATRFTANESGTISLDFRGISDAVSLKWASATIKFYGLDKLGFADTATSAEILAKLNVYDDNGLMLDKSALLANSGTYVWACGVGETECHVFTIWVNHFTTYKISSNTTNDNSSHWGGGGGSSVSKDTCENGDYSASYYDGICGTKPVISTGAIFIEPIADELVAAYKRAYIKDITTMDTISWARVQAFLTRWEMSKMIVNYAINILGKKIDTSKKASFKDINLESEEMKWYINKAYQLWLMGIDVINFNPQWLVTRGEFATILARLLYQEEAEGAGFYYDKPIEILRQNGIIKNTNPMMQEVRWYVMLMLMRSSQ